MAILVPATVVRPATPARPVVPGHLVQRGRPVVAGGRDLLGNPVRTAPRATAASAASPATAVRAPAVPLRPLVAQQVFFERVPRPVAAIAHGAPALRRVRTPPAWRSAVFYVGLLAATFGVHAAYYL